jgi:hypothetical protein
VRLPAIGSQQICDRADVRWIGGSGRGAVGQRGGEVGHRRPDPLGDRGAEGGIGRERRGDRCRRQFCPLVRSEPDKLPQRCWHLARRKRADRVRGQGNNPQPYRLRKRKSRSWAIDLARSGGPTPCTAVLADLGTGGPAVLATSDGALS